jgi:hypothetical protein
MTEGCGFTGPREEFPLCGSNKQRSRRCRPCKQAYDRLQYHTRRDKLGLRAASKERKKRTKQFVGEYLIGKGCLDCSNDNPIVLEFDHRVDEIKRGNIGDLANKLSIESLMEEIAKCDIVCANCHRIRTWKRAGGTIRVPMPV